MVADLFTKFFGTIDERLFGTTHLAATLHSLLQTLLTNLSELRVWLPFRPLIAIGHPKRNLKERVGIGHSSFHVPVRIELVRRFVIALGSKIALIFNSNTLGIQSRNAFLRQAELVGPKVEAFLRLRIGSDSSALPCNHILKYVLERCVPKSNDLNLIVIAPKNVTFID